MSQGERNLDVIVLCVRWKRSREWMKKQERLGEGKERARKT